MFKGLSSALKDFLKFRTNCQSPLRFLFTSYNYVIYFSFMFVSLVIICTGNVKQHFSVVPLTQTNLTPYKTITEYNDRMECVMSCLHKSQTCSGFYWQGTNCTLYKMTCSVVEEWQQGNATRLQKIMAHSGLQFSKNLSTKTGKDKTYFYQSLI